METNAEIRDGQRHQPLTISKDEIANESDKKKKIAIIENEIHLKNQIRDLKEDLDVLKKKLTDEETLEEDLDVLTKEAKRRLQQTKTNTQKTKRQLLQNRFLYSVRFNPYSFSWTSGCENVAPTQTQPNQQKYIDNQKQKGEQKRSGCWLRIWVGIISMDRHGYCVCMWEPSCGDPDESDA